MDIQKLINDSQKEDSKGKKTQKYMDVVQDQPHKKRPGRPNKGLNEKSRLEYNEKRNREYKEFTNIKQNEHFNSEIVEAVGGEVVNEDDIKEFTELYNLTVDTVLDNFKAEHDELIKKHPNIWYKPLLMEVKKNTPKITIDNIDKCGAVWDCLRNLLNSIGLFMTFEAFSKVTGIYKYQIENNKDLSPKYRAFSNKIYNDCKDDLQTELYYSPINSVNKIYLNKAVYGVIEKTEPKQIEVHHDIRNYDNLPMFGDKNN